MLKTDKNALICDLAETYHIYDYEQLPINRVAVFACGLPADSRIMRKLSGQNVPLNTLLIAGIFDQINAFMYSLTKDAKRGTHRPQSLVDLLMGKTEQRDTVGFASGEDFDKKRAELLNRINQHKQKGDEA